MNSDNFFIKKLKKPIFPRFFLNRPHNNNRAFSTKIDKKMLHMKKNRDPVFKGYPVCNQNVVIFLNGNVKTWVLFLFPFSTRCPLLSGALQGYWKDFGPEHGKEAGAAAF